MAKRRISLLVALALVVGMSASASAHHRPDHAGGRPAGGPDQPTPAEDPEPEVPEPDPETPEEPADPEDPDPPEPPEDPEHSPAAVDASLTGHHHGFTVEADETVEVLGEVTTDANVVVYGTLRMRPGSSITFVDVDENAFVGPGDVHAPVDEDVGLWVFDHGQLDIQGTPTQGWNRTGTHSTWDTDAEYVQAPIDVGDRDGQPWTYGDAVPCVEFAGDHYCAEIANLTRDVTIQGTDEGRAHIFIRSDQPQTIRHAELRHLGPNGDSDDDDGRYALHFHMMHDGSRGSLVEGVVVRDAGDYAFVPHHSDGITFRDTVAYNVVNAAYWWDHGEVTNDTRYEDALAVEVHRGRLSSKNTTGFRMGRGTGNVCDGCVAAGVQRGRPSSGFLWDDGPSEPNKWEFRNSVSHNNTNGVYHWLNERQVQDEAHVHHGFVTYHNRWYGIEQGAYTNMVRWHDLVSFGNDRDAVRQRSASKHGDLDPGVLYEGATIGGDRTGIRFTSMRFCGYTYSPFVIRDTALVGPWDDHPVYIVNDECSSDNETLTIRFENVTVDGSPITLDDIAIRDRLPEGQAEIWIDGVLVAEG